MRWEGREGSSNIEDRRGMRIPGGRGGGFGCIGLLVVLGISLLTGADPRALLGILGLVGHLRRDAVVRKVMIGEAGRDLVADDGKNGRRPDVDFATSSVGRPQNCLRRNLGLVPRSAARLRPCDVDAAVAELTRSGERFDLIFLDPPYTWGITESTLTSLAGIASLDAELAVEHSRRNPPPAEARGWIRRDLRRYGDSALSIYGRTEL